MSPLSLHQVKERLKLNIFGCCFDVKQIMGKTSAILHLLIETITNAELKSYMYCNQAILNSVTKLKKTLLMKNAMQLQGSKIAFL